jgi:hypothetical protein
MFGFITVSCGLHAVCPLMARQSGGLINPLVAGSSPVAPHDTVGPTKLKTQVLFREARRASLRNSWLAFLNIIREVDVPGLYMRDCRGGATAAEDRHVDFERGPSYI